MCITWQRKLPCQWPTKNARFIPFHNGNIKQAYFSQLIDLANLAGVKLSLTILNLTEILWSFVFIERKPY